MKIVQKITAFLLAGIFLISSLGFTISSMVCTKSGKGKVSFAIIEDCCAKKKIAAPGAEADCCDEEEENDYPEDITVIKKGECCEINSHSFQLNDFQNAKKLSVEEPAVLPSLFHSSETIAFSDPGNKLSFQYTDLPPPLHGRDLLNFISILII